MQAYEDADAFNFQFVNRGMDPAPRHARVTITPAFETPAWDYANTRVWAFGFDGEINVRDGAVVAETFERMDSGSSVICLVRFEKGIFQPAVEKGGPFQALLDKALEGSSYGEDPAEKWFLALFALIFLSGLALLIWVAVSVALGYKWKKSLFGTHKIDGWFRDVPLEGNLPAAYYLLAKGKRFEAGAPANNLIGAFFLRWIMNGQVSVQPDSRDYRRVNLSFREAEISTGSPVEESLYRMAREAAGGNLLLEKGEFEKWSTSNYKQITGWPGKALSEGRQWFAAKGYFVRRDECTQEGATQACRLVQFQRFLREFTLSKERGAAEVGLWKEYLVFAQLFGIAEKVAREFRKLYPVQFAEIAGNSGMDPVTMMYAVRWTNSLSTRAFANAVARAGNVNGTGGRASFGGGGGFSGGGFGGGGR